MRCSCGDLLEVAGARSPYGDLGQRSVTVSTVGLAPAIRKLADEKMQVRLAVSLHTPDDELLAKRLRKHLGQLVHVNVIPLNPTPGSKWDASPKPVEREFVRL